MRIRRTRRNESELSQTDRVATRNGDARAHALLTWAKDALGIAPSWSPINADASVRRYFRGCAGGRTWIAVDAPPAEVDNPAFVRVAQLMGRAGLNVPTIVAYERARGFMLLSDLGTVRYIDALTGANAESLYAAAIDALIAWQLASRPNVLPVYNQALLYAEMSLFRDWYIKQHLGHRPSQAERRDIDAAFTAILDRVGAQPRVYVHRDYMPRNLLVADPLPGVIDFQDARYGPVTYDIVSLCQDAFLSWPVERVRAWHHRYWRLARANDLPVAGDWTEFCRDAELMGVQRHLKILGIFARLAYRDGKSDYLADAPRFADYLGPVLAGDARLAPLQRYLVAPTR